MTELFYIMKMNRMGNDKLLAARDCTFKEAVEYAKQIGADYINNYEGEIEWQRSDRFGVWCAVWGGVTGSRASWLKSNGEIQIFESREAAEQVARRLDASTNGNPHRCASFSYTVRAFS